MARTKKNSNGSSAATVGFEQKLWAAADALRNNMDAAEYKHVASALQRVLTSVEQSLTLGVLCDALLPELISGELQVHDSVRVVQEVICG